VVAEAVRVTISQKVLWPTVLNAAVGFGLVVLGEVVKDAELRGVGLGILGASGVGGGVGFAVPHVSEKRRAVR
jgi:hypothetical protein